MVSVRGLIMGFAASSKTPYKDLKAKLVSSYTLLRWQKVSKLIHHSGLGDSREFKNPSLWDARKAISTYHLLAAASTSLSSPSRGRTQDRRSPSPNHCSQTLCYFHQRFGPAANNCRPPCSFQGNARADRRRKN